MLWVAPTASCQGNDIITMHEYKQQMKTNTSTKLKVKDTFTMIDDNLLSTPISKITAQQKLFISWILRFQKNNLTCFASNKKIGETLGMSKEGIKTLIKSCTLGFPSFFECTPDTYESGVPFHTITINLMELMKFISDDKPTVKTKRRNSVKNSPIQPEIKPTETVEKNVVKPVVKQETIQSNTTTKKSKDEPEQTYDMVKFFGDYCTNDKKYDVIFNLIETVKTKFKKTSTSITVIQYQKVLDLIQTDKYDKDLKDYLQNKIESLVSLEPAA